MSIRYCSKLKACGIYHFIFYMFTISNQSDYGLIILSLLHKKKNFVSLTELVEKTSLPKRFLARIAATLVNHGFLISKEGRVGGYQLVKNLKETNLYEFLKIFEGDITTTKCSVEEYDCKFEEICDHKDALKTKVNGIVRGQLERVKLSEVV